MVIFFYIITSERIYNKLKKGQPKLSFFYVQM